MEHIFSKSPIQCSFLLLSFIFFDTQFCNEIFGSRRCNPDIKGNTHTQKNMQVFSKMCTRTNNCSFYMSQFLPFHAIGLLSHSYTKNTRLMFRGYDEFEYFEQRFISLMLNSLQAFVCKCSVVYLLSVKFILYWNNSEIN